MRNIDQAEENDDDINHLRRRCRNMVVVAAASHAEIQQLCTPCLRTPDKIPVRHSTFESFSEQEYDQKIGFAKTDAIKIFEALNIPNQLTFYLRYKEIFSVI
tara:strand:+ start:116 stop:421 length:306 start_codon:yes stop_codon:yes gene_type:complete